jgi:co-chaperonin GroES (HSP10)
MKKFKPLHDRILVKRLEEKEVKKGGIIIPARYDGRPSS